MLAKLAFGVAANDRPILVAVQVMATPPAPDTVMSSGLAVAAVGLPLRVCVAMLAMWALSITPVPVANQLFNAAVNSVTKPATLPSSGTFWPLVTQKLAIPADTNADWRHTLFSCALSAMPGVNPFS